MLRKEKNVSQRLAAQELGISQALLSHYENGIRECSLDFVRKAAGYYGVTADYLLGISESRRGTAEIYLPERIETDAEITNATVLRALMYLSEKSMGAGETDAAFFCDYFSLAADKYLRFLSGEPQAALLLEDLSETKLLDERRQDRRTAQNFSQTPAYFDTVTENARRLVDAAARSLLETT